MPAAHQAFAADDDPILPQILSEADRARYERIFALQEAGQLPAAAKEIAALEDPILMGHVLAQKYLHPTAYRSRYEELRAWLADYPDHPSANRIFDLALQRKPSGAANPPQPTVGERGPVGFDEAAAAITLPMRSLAKDQRGRLARLQGRMRERIRGGWPTGALEVLESAEYRALVTDAQHDAYAARIAWSYYLHDKDGKALEYARSAAERSRAYVPDADWVAGLAAWRLDKVDIARRHFEALGSSPVASRWLRAAGSYWAARCNLRTGQPEEVSSWLVEAAASPRTFYGLLAVQALGYEAPLEWHPAGGATKEDGFIIEAMPGALRAAALMEAGQTVRAEEEMRFLYGHTSPRVIEALHALAAHLGLPAVQMGLAQRRGHLDGTTMDAAAYPMPKWEPPGGFAVDRALIFGLIRQESSFRTHVRSRSGAAGVMQLMPATAQFAAKEAGLNGHSRRDLSDPRHNIALGQAYIRHLLDLKTIRGNLFFLLAAYNGGPGNLGNWLAGTNFGDDPLLFIESIRSRETRFFIERVLTNYWIYRLQLGQDTPSLDAVASGDWPSYAPQDP
jgi:soluble lytic murein transglycosylase-like protein